MIDKTEVNTARQNRLILVCRDLCGYAPQEVVMDSLLRRGVFKWLAVRQDVIRAKERWRKEITGTIAAIRMAKEAGDRMELAYLRGRLEALQKCRQEIRRYCHSSRWRAPDNDRYAWDYLERNGGNPT